MSVELIGLHRIMRKLESLEQMQRVLEPVLEKGGERIREDARNQPPKRAGAFSALATEGQRRAYWARVRSGKAQHGPNGYIRSGTLRDKWKRAKVERIANGLRVVVENDAPYAPFVRGEGYQQPFHKESGWFTEGKLIERSAGAIFEDARVAIRRELNK